MQYSIKQTRRFARTYKKLHTQLTADVDQAVMAVAANPKLGERKKGDLAQLYVYKFYSNKQLYLLGYSLDETICIVYLEAVGPHENFYRNIKR